MTDWTPSHHEQADVSRDGRRRPHPVCCVAAKLPRPRRRANQLATKSSGPGEGHAAREVLFVMLPGEVDYHSLMRPVRSANRWVKSDHLAKTRALGCGLWSLHATMCCPANMQPATRGWAVVDPDYIVDRLTEATSPFMILRSARWTWTFPILHRSSHFHVFLAHSLMHRPQIPTR